MLVDKQNELMSDLLFTIHQHGGDDVTWKPPITAISAALHETFVRSKYRIYSTISRAIFTQIKTEVN